MSRPKRIQYRDAYYHVMNRGRGQCRVYFSRVYFEAFLNTVADAVERFNVQIHAYCLMPNHYHLLVKTPDANLDRAMRHINGVYTQRHNVLKRTDGSLFRGRYKAIVVDHESYYFALTRYIHRNPIDARRPLTQRLEDYPWSSYPAYIGHVAAPPWLYLDEVTAAFGSNRSSSSYAEYVERKNDDDIVNFYSKRRLAPVLGNDKFKIWVQNTYLAPHREHAQHQTRINRPTVNQIVAHVADYFNLQPVNVRKGEYRKKNVPRWIAMYLCQQQGSHPLHHIAAQFGVNHYTSVSKLISKLRADMQCDTALAQHVEQLTRIIRS